MAYADQQMSNNRIIALIIVALLHIGLGYALVTGLAFDAVQEAVKRVTTVEIKDEPEPEPEEPPPPPEEVPETVPPPYIPPSAMPPLKPQPPRETSPIIPPTTPPSVNPNKVCPNGSVVPSGQACPPPGPETKNCPAPDGSGGTITIRADANCPPVKKPEPEKPKFTPKDPTPKGNPGNWANASDYPARALREEREGVTRFRVSVSADGKVASCSVTGSSGHSDLDDTTCKLVSRRGRFNPATDGNGAKVSGSWSSAVRWQIPK